MKILVCIKQVPDMASRFTLNEEGRWLDETDLAFRMNEYDEFAVEEAVRLKERLGGMPDITVLSIGPDRVQEVLKKALAMGCDRGVHVKDEGSHKKDSFQIASIIHEFCKEKDFHLIFTGFQSQDRGSAQVGGSLAGMLNIPCITGAMHLSFQEGTLTAKRELEGGLRAGVRVKTPALVTCQTGLNTPRYPTLPNIMKAKKKELATVEADALVKGEDLLPTERMFFPERKARGEVLEGDVNEMAERLVKILKEKTSVIR